MTSLWIDFESRSHCDLLKHGVYNYARDPSTEVLCMSYAFDDEPVKTWTPNLTFPTDVLNHKGEIRAHNAAFERLIFSYVLQVKFDLTQFYCTAAQARANCAPGSLEDVGRFSGASMRKDHRGAQLIRLLCVPPFNDDPKLMAEMIDYCAQDVRAMREISKAMRQLSAQELADYHVNERINDRGVLVDIPLCKAAIEYAEDEKVEIQQIVAEVTEGEITSVRSPKMREWVLARVGDEAKKLMWNGEKYSIDKAVRANLLAMDDYEEIPGHVADVIQCADDLWASSVAKFNRLSQLADEDDARVRGAFVFAGGSATGRASSYGAQVHNFTRLCAKLPDDVRQAMVRGHEIAPKFGKRVTDVLKGMLRPALVAKPGHVFVGADWSAIEGRVHPWLSNCASGEKKLDAFRQDLDPYIVNAAATYNMSYAAVEAEYTSGNAAKRQIGKVQELALGFLGGAGAFSTFGRVYGVHLPEADVKRAVNAWRRANTWAIEHGQALEEAYTRAMRNVGREFSAGRVTYLFDGQTLWYALPSGRVLCYPFARLEPEGVSYAKASWKPKADAKEWPRGRLWRGLACENVTQATANDLLRHSLRQLDNVVLHVHDEIVLEVPEEETEAAKQRLQDVMCTAPAWASDLPLKIGVEVSTRFK